MKCYFIVLLIFLTTACGDKGENVPKSNVHPDSAVNLINEFLDPADLLFRHGAGICFGYWSYQLYKSCEHPFHGETGEKKITELRIFATRGNSSGEVLSLCQSELEKTYKPVGVEFKDLRVIEREKKGIFDCYVDAITTKYKKLRSAVCGVETDAGEVREIVSDTRFQHRNEFLLDGYHGQFCSTCDHLPIKDAKSFKEKVECLFDQYIKTETRLILAYNQELDRKNIRFDQEIGIDIDVDSLFEDDTKEASSQVTDVKIEDRKTVPENPEFIENITSLSEVKDEITFNLSCIEKYYSKLLSGEQQNKLRSVLQNSKIICN